MEILEAEELNMSWQCLLAAQKDDPDAYRSTRPDKMHPRALTELAESTGQDPLHDIRKVMAAR